MNTLKRLIALALVVSFAAPAHAFRPRLEYLASAAVAGGGVICMISSRNWGSEADGWKAQYNFADPAAAQNPEKQLILARYEHARHYEDQWRDVGIGLFLISGIIFTHAFFWNEGPKRTAARQGFEVAPKPSGADVRYSWAF